MIFCQEGGTIFIRINMQGGLVSGILSLRKWTLIFSLLTVFVGTSFSYASATNDADREQLIALSLQNSRKPQYLDSLAVELLKYEDQECKSRAYFLRGLSATYQGMIDSALGYYQKSLALIPIGGQYDRRFTYSMVMKNLGIAYYRQGFYQQGDSIFSSLIAISKESGDSLSYALALSNIGNALSLRRDFDGAIEKYKEAILIEENLGSKGVASTYLKIGTIFGRMSQEQEALSWFRKAKARIPKGDYRLQGRVFNNIAVAFRGLGILDSAQVYLKQALALYQKSGSLIDQAMALENLVRNEISLENFSKAESILKDAYSLFPEGVKPKNFSISRLWMLSLDLALTQGDVVKADTLIKKLTKNKVELQNPLDFLRLKSRYFELAGSKDSAIYYLKELQAKEKEINTQNDASKIKKEANVVELAEIKRKEKEAEEETLFRYWLLAFSLLVLAFLLFYFNRKFKRKAMASASGFESDSLQEALVKDEYAPLKVQKEEESKAPALRVLQLKSKAVIKVDEILYLRSEGHYINIYLENRENPEVERASLSSLLEDLGDEQFQRIHRSYAVNMKHLKAAYSNRVLLNNGQELPVTRTYTVALRERFNKN